MFNPPFQCRNHVERVRSFAATEVAHAWHKKQAQRIRGLARPILSVTSSDISRSESRLPDSQSRLGNKDVHTESRVCKLAGAPTMMPP